MTLDPAAVQNGATTVQYFAAAVAAGASMSTLWLVRGHSGWSADRAALPRLCALAGSAFALLASLVVLWLESASMAEVPWTQAGPAMWTMLSATHYGAAWSVGASALGLAVMLNIFVPRRFAALGTVAALALFWYTRSVVSHAASDGDLSVPLIADWVHLAFVSLWLGEVFVAGFVTLAGASPCTEGDWRDRASYVASLSSSATFALAGIFMTGLFGVWHNLGSVADLLGNPYGEALLAKLAMVGLAVLLGGVNRYFLMPAWLAAESAGHQAPPALPVRFRRILQVEAVFLLAALVLAVVLAATSPPGT